MIDNSKLRFWQSYGNIDIWQDQDTVSGQIKYLFWFDNKSYECSSEKEILALARQLSEQKLKTGLVDKGIQR
jgi:hypothetical protein